jgi:hypothetical protein
VTLTSESFTDRGSLALSARQQLALAARTAISSGQRIVVVEPGRTAQQDPIDSDTVMMELMFNGVPRETISQAGDAGEGSDSGIRIVIDRN